MSQSEKLLSEKYLLDSLRKMGDQFAPARIRVVESVRRVRPFGRLFDAIVDIDWNNRSFRFAVEFRVPFNPKAIQDSVQQVTVLAKQLKLNPLIITPYLSDVQLRSLEAQRVSGIDLCGNGIIIVPNRLLIYRTGNPNKYPSSGPIRNVYRGASSLVARAFILCPEYETSRELLDEITKRGGDVTLSTVSKVCSSLEDDLIIQRKRQGRTTRLRLMQAEKLLDSLAENYVAPVVQEQFIGKCGLDERELESLARDWSRDTKQRITRTGSCSSDRYATMAREPIRRYYCTDAADFLTRLDDSVRETDRFPTFQVLETNDPTVYFDVRDDIEASPLQSFLELSAGDKRERETGEQIRQRLIQDVDSLKRLP